MKSFKILPWVLFFLWFTIIKSAPDNVLDNFQINMIRHSELIIEGKVLDIQNVMDEKFIQSKTLTILVSDIIEGKKTGSKILINYPVNVVCDGVWSEPKFKINDHFIAFLQKNWQGFWEPIGGGYGVLKIKDGRIEKSALLRMEFLKQLDDVRNFRTNKIDFPIQGDIADDQYSIEKLGGEFTIMGPEYYGPSKGSLITFYINPDGALDEDGNQLSFNEVKNAIQRAINTWNNVSQAYATFAISATQYNGTQSYSDDISTITFQNLDVNAQARRQSLEEEIHEVDLVFNKGRNIAGIPHPLRWNTETNYPSAYVLYPSPYKLSYPDSVIGPVDLEDVAAHELGHAVGLHHVNYTLYTLYPTDYAANEWWEKTYRRTLEVGDIAGKVYQDPDFLSSATQSNAKILLSSRATTTIVGTYTVPSTYSLNIEAGKTIDLSSGVSLVINGTLNAVGTSNDRITFTNNSGTWGGIKFYSGSSGEVKYSDISNATYGAYISNATPNIQNCNITGNSYGIRIYNSYSTDWINDPIKANVIEDNSSYGVYLYNSSPTLKGNTVYNNNIGVALFTNCNSVVTLNNINSNDYYGFSCYGSSSPFAYYSSTYSKGGYNQFRWNGTEEVKITGTSNPNFGMGSYHGNNSFTDGSGYLMYNTTANTIVAERNWWGYSTGPLGSQLYGSIDYYPYLASDPNGSQIVQTDRYAVNKPSDENQTTTSDELSKAMNAFYEGNYQAAASMFREYIMKNYTEENIISVVQYYIISLSQVENKGSVISAVNQLKNLSMTTRAQADLSGLYAALLERNGNYSEAIAELDDAVTTKATTENKNQLKLQKAHLLIHSLGQKEKGEEVLTQILNEEKQDSYLFEIASIELKMLGSTEGQLLKDNLIAAVDEELPTEYGLANNYPNPFNPSTTISFALPQQEKVELIVYDMLGRKVAELVNETLDAGKYNINFDGRGLSSGMYIYNITAGSFTKSKKMLLLK